MKRAFDDNVSKAKPRLSLGRALAGVVESDAAQPSALVPPPPKSTVPVARFVPVPHADSPVALDAHAIAQRVAAEHPARDIETPAHVAPQARAAPQSTPEPEVMPAFEATHAAPAPAARVAAPEAAEVLAPDARAARAPDARVGPAVTSAPPPEAAIDPRELVSARRERLKERLKRATSPLSVRDPAPASAAEAEAASLSMIGQLQEALERAEAENVALRTDVETARAQLSLAASEARERTDEAQALVAESTRRSALLADLEGELGALEAERDDALGQLLGARDELESSEKHAAGLVAQLHAKDSELLEAVGEEERMAAELDLRTEEVATLRGLTAALTTERDALLSQVSTLTRERTELSDSRKALESVHRALADARSRAQPRR